MAKYKYVIWLFISILLIACNKKSKNQESKIEGELLGYTLNYVINKRDWCRFSSIIIDVKIKNNSNSDLNLDFDNLEDQCDFESQGEIVLNLKDYNISAISLARLKKRLRPGEEFTSKFRIQKQHTYENNSLYLDFGKVLTNQKNIGFINLRVDNKVILNIDKTLEKTYLLDDEKYENSKEFIEIYKTRYFESLEY